MWHLRKLGLREINLPKATQLGSGEDSNQTQVCLTPEFLGPTYQSLVFLMHVVYHIPGQSQLCRIRSVFMQMITFLWLENLL